MTRILMTKLLLILLVATTQAATPESYQKLWRDPALNARIEQNIEKYRKSDATIVVTDTAGRPIQGASIEARQTGHEFLFGCNAFVLGQLKPEGMERRYEEAFLKLFNFATVPFYWEGTEPNRGELRYEDPASDFWRRPPPGRFLPWAARNGITLKGHPLQWHAYNPKWLPNDPDELRALYRKRFREIADRFAGKIGIWDAVNESLVCPKTYPLFTPDRAYVAWAFQEIAPLFPKETILMINEVTSYNFPPASDKYFDQIKTLLAGGAEIRGIGFQYHYFRRAALDAFLKSPRYNPSELLNVYEKFGEFNLPLYITEITIPSAGDGGEPLQAEVVRDHYRLWFSVPRMAGITWWNLGDGTAVKGENEAMGGLLDAELNPKLAYKALDQLINTDWKTRVSLQTDAQGHAQFRGFHGAYEVTVTQNGVSIKRSLHLKKNAPNHWVLEIPFTR